jgi:hypothetical protein
MRRRLRVRTICTERLEIDRIEHDFVCGRMRILPVKVPPQLIEAVGNIAEPTVEQMFLRLRRLGQRA